MLNILLSALIDPDRRLRSFRRSERLASILVGIILGVLYTSFIQDLGEVQCSVSVFFRHVLEMSIRFPRLRYGWTFRVLS